MDDLLDDKLKSPDLILPFKKDVLRDVLQSMKLTLHNNFLASLLSVGKLNNKYIFYFYLTPY